MANDTLMALEAALDRAVEAAVTAQAAVSEARDRAKLPKAPKVFYTTAEMIGELVAADDRAHAKMIDMVRAAIADTRHRLRDPTYRPSAEHHWASIGLSRSFGKEDNLVPLKPR